MRPELKAGPALETGRETLRRARKVAEQAITGVGRRAGRLTERVTEPVQDYRTSLRGEGTVEGAARIPWEGPAILVANHRHLLDGRVLQAHLPRASRVVDVNRLGDAVRQRRAHDEERSDAWTHAFAALGRGELVIVFPEGAPSPDPAVHKGHTALGWLVLAAQRIGTVPVVPISLDSRQGRIVVGQPVDFSRHADLVPDRTLARGVVDEVMDELTRVVGTHYVDTLTTTARASLRSAGAKLRDGRRLDALARRDAERRAEVQRRVDAQLERADMAERARRASEAAREQALAAAERDRLRGSTEPGGQ